MHGLKRGNQPEKKQKGSHAMTARKIQIFSLLFAMFAAISAIFAVGADAGYQNGLFFSPAGGNEKADFAQQTDEAQEVIALQLAALQARDAEGAYALTSGRLHRASASANDFLGNMRAAYRPLYNHEQVDFVNAQQIGNTLVQTVSLTDRHGNSYLVFYRLVLQDGELRINSITYSPAGGQAI